MAVDVNQAGFTTAYLANSAPLVRAVPISMFCWFRINDAFYPSSQSHLIIVTDNGGPTGKNYLLEIDGVATKTVKAFKSTPLLHFGTATSTGTYSLNTWHAAGAVWASNSSAFAYLDGVAGPEDTSSFTVVGSGLTNTYLAASVGLTGPVQAFDGCLAALSIWQIALTPTEMLSLYNGADPRTIQSSFLVSYVPMVNAATVGNDTQGNSWTVITGSGSYSDCSTSPPINPIPPVQTPRRYSAMIGPVRAGSQVIPVPTPPITEEMDYLGGYIDDYLDSYT